MRKGDTEIKRDNKVRISNESQKYTDFFLQLRVHSKQKSFKGYIEPLLDNDDNSILDNKDMTFIFDDKFIKVFKKENERDPEPRKRVYQLNEEMLSINEIKTEKVEN